LPNDYKSQHSFWEVSSYPLRLTQIQPKGGKACGSAEYLAPETVTEKRARPPLRETRKGGSGIFGSLLNVYVFFGRTDARPFFTGDDCNTYEKEKSYYLTEK
jgi:hypothetical protein